MRHRSEKGWTAATAVEGTGKESGGKGVTAACRLLLPLPLPWNTIKRAEDNFTLAHPVNTCAHT